MSHLSLLFLKFEFSSFLLGQYCLSIFLIFSKIFSLVFSIFFLFSVSFIFILLFIFLYLFLLSFSLLLFSQFLKGKSQTIDLRPFFIINTYNIYSYKFPYKYYFSCVSYICLKEYFLYQRENCVFCYYWVEYLVNGCCIQLVYSNFEQDLEDQQQRLN